MSTIKKLAGQTAIYGVSSIIGRLLNYLLVPLHTHEEYGFGEADYGIISEFYAYVAFFIVLLTFGMETTFFRFVNKSVDKEKTFNQAASFVFILSILFFLTILVFSQSIANWMGYPEMKNFVVWFGAILAIDATTSMFLAKLRHQNRPVKFAVVQLSSIGVNILLNIIFIFGFYDNTHPDASLGVGFIFLANLIASFVKPLVLYKEVASYRFVWDKVMTKAMFIFALPLVIAGFAGIVNETLDRILIKRLLMGDGSEEQLEYAQAQVGIYSANYKLSILITLFIQAFRYAAEPFFFAQEKNEEKDKIYSRVMTYFIIVVSLMFLVIALNLDIFKWFIPNKDYHEGLKVVPILLMANICLGIYYNQSIWYKLADRTIYGAYIAIGGAVITIVLNIILIPIIGYMGSAWTTLAAYSSMMVASYFFGQKIYPIKYNLRKAALYILSALSLYFVGTVISFDHLVYDTIYSLFLILLFIGIAWFMERPKISFRK
ncbi:MAG: oligosaccharide flippase family protein [Crocinitomicaceae bacterium]|nr:oligosaccharide flippase family protein [Crocinitomicaceae bacterium]